MASEAHEGPGVYRTELRDGRLFAWARQGASLDLVAKEAGAYSVHGELWLRPGETIVIARAGSEIGRVQSWAQAEGAVPLALDLVLPAGRTELHPESDQEERDVGGARDHKAVAFGLFVPVLETARMTR